MLNNTIYIGQAGPKGTEIGTLEVGTLVKANEAGAPVEFYLAKHDYESGLNGSGKDLIVRKNYYSSRVWDSGNVNSYAVSDIDKWFNGTYKNLLDPGLATLIGTTKFYYTPGEGNNTVSTLERSIFGLSLIELGENQPGFNTEGSILPISSLLKSGLAPAQWTRTPSTSYTYMAAGLLENGTCFSTDCRYSYGARPCFTLPSDVRVDDDLNIIVA